MEDSFESVNKSVDLDNPSEHSVDLDDPGKQCSKGLSDDLPSDSSLGRLMDTSQDVLQLTVPKAENFSRNHEDVEDIHVGKVFEKQEVEESTSDQQQSSGEEYNDELERQQQRSRQGRRCSARLKGKTRKRWSSKDHSFYGVKAVNVKQILVFDISCEV